MSYYYFSIVGADMNCNMDNLSIGAKLMTNKDKNTIRQTNDMQKDRQKKKEITIFELKTVFVRDV